MKKLNILNVLQPYLILVKVMGFFPQAFGNTKVYLIIFNIIYSILMVSIPICVAVGSMMVNNLPLMLELWKIVAITGSFMIFLQGTIQLIKNNELLIFLKKLCDFDKKAQMYGIFIDLNSEKKKILCLTFSVIAMPIDCITVALDMDSSYASVGMIALNLAHAYQLILEYFFVVQFSIFTMIIKNRFIGINNYLKSSLIISRISGKATNLKQFRTLHWNLCEIVRDFNRIFTLNLTFTLINILFNTILSMYSSVFYFYRSKNVSTIISSDLIINVAWMVLHMIFAVIICHDGHSVHVATEKTEFLLLEFIGTNNKHEIMNRELESLHYRVKNTDKSIQNVFFVVNWKLSFVVSFSTIKKSFL